MANTTNPRRNAEGYPDPTAYEALKNIDCEEDERFHRLLHTLFSPLLFGGFGQKPTFEKIFERVRTIFLKKAQKKWAKARF